ncbi:MAG: hypothetical protein IJ737_01985 [Ruminococcus sp.]|nr:hypothetical protein [Ruminococcus sp.]
MKFIKCCIDKCIRLYQIFPDKTFGRPVLGDVMLGITKTKNIKLPGSDPFGV